MWRRSFLLFGYLSLIIMTTSVVEAHDFEWTLRSRDQLATTFEKQTWEAEETGFIVCDMWDYHHSVNAVQRLKGFAPKLDRVLSEARNRGATIIHAPSDCMPFYKEHAARQRALAVALAANAPERIAEWCHRIPEEELATYPIDQSDGGEDDDVEAHARWAAYLESIGRNPGTPWKRQTKMLTIDDQCDFIAAEGDVVWNILEDKQIKRVVLVGVHTNMCVLGRPFGLRQMKRAGKEVILMRDMTDVMYDPNDWPYVSHFAGIDLVIEHIERWVCPTITSDQVIGGQPFRFRNDRRATVGILAPTEEASMIAENLRHDFRIHCLGGEGPDLNNADLYYVIREPLAAMDVTARPIVQLSPILRKGESLKNDHPILQGTDKTALLALRDDGTPVVSTNSRRIAFNSCFWLTGQAVPETMPGLSSQSDRHWILKIVPKALAELPESTDASWWRALMLVPHSWKERPLKLQLDCFGESAEVYLNGTLLASRYLHSEQLLFGELNHLAIHVKGGSNGQVGEDSPPALHHPNGEALSLSGRWQMRLGDDPSWKDFPIPPQFGASTDNIFEFRRSGLVPVRGLVPNRQGAER
ncbi:MAG: isochorismatase family protein [Verrucomicrobiaceae bacterium]|nr:isochorismatase family protein [Verrucomicrobiaceae bacterium]